MAVINSDERAWPLVIVVWPEQPLTDQALDTFLELTRRQSARGPHVALHLTDGSSGLSSSHRQRIAQFMQDNAALLREGVLAGAIVVKNPIIRGMVTAIKWLTPPPFPQRLFAKRTDAEAWLDATLERAGLAVRADEQERGEDQSGQR